MTPPPPERPTTAVDALVADFVADNAEVFHERLGEVVATVITCVPALSIGVALHLLI